MTTETRTIDLRAARLFLRDALIDSDLEKLTGITLTADLVRVLRPRPREKGVSGGWQGGKSVEAALENYIKDNATMSLLSSGMVPEDHTELRWLIVPSYKSPHKEFDYLKEWHRKDGSLSYTHEPREGSQVMTCYGGHVKYETKTARDIPAIAGEPCHDVTVCEAGQMVGAILEQARGRLVTFGGDLNLNGTVEDVTGKPMWAWYPKLLREWQENPDPVNHMAYELPSWANPVAFPGGREDPKILQAELDNPKFVFDRRYGGKPLGHQYLVYPELSAGSWEDQVARWSWNCSDEGQWAPELGVGGHDYGTTYLHPMTLVPMTMVRGEGILVVRTAWSELTSDVNLVETQRQLLSQRYQINNNRWGFDPMQKYAANILGAAVMEDNNDSRLHNAGLVSARLNRKPELLRFDFNDAMALEVFKQMQDVHLALHPTPTQGEKFYYNRVDDDLSAGVEYGVKVADEGEGPDYASYLAKMAEGREEAPGPTNDPHALRREPPPRVVNQGEKPSSRRRPPPPRKRPRPRPRSSRL